MMRQKTIYYTGSLPREGEAPYGGGEVGNLRTIRMLKSFGYNVKAVRRRRSGVKDSWRKTRLMYPLRTLANVCEWFFVLLFGSRNNSVAHISGFYGITIYVETLQVFIAHLLGYRIVYELRGGGATEFYENGRKIYKKQFRYILNKANYLLSQGKENEHLLNSLCSAPVFYYPNCVQRGDYPKEIPPKDNIAINLIFFGRIEADKNPLMIVKAVALLQKEFDNITLTILGNGQTELVEKVKEQMQKTLLLGSWHLLPGCAHEELLHILINKHFFIFPSQQIREGQSNAVTEAMGYGVIPIASPQGFNRSTIGDNALIVEELSAEAYAGRISTIIREGKIEKYSKGVRQRFLENYTEEVVFEQAKKTYETIFASEV